MLSSACGGAAAGAAAVVSSASAAARLPLLFLDLDGVIVDFDAGVIAAGIEPAPFNAPGRSRGAMWKALARVPAFFSRLPWMAGGAELWRLAEPHAPTIVTGLPLGEWAAPQKRVWCTRELGAHVRVITCMARQKAHFAGEVVAGVPGSHLGGAVLVDDNADARDPWEAAGGLFIHHTDIAKTLRELRTIGFGATHDLGESAK